MNKIRVKRTKTEFILIIILYQERLKKKILKDENTHLVKISSRRSESLCQ